jgi:anaerobic selenocysteine-containing dehydrogenase
MHPDDARTRGVERGAMVSVQSRTGAIRVPVEITTDIAPGVVCLPHGWGHDKGGELRVAREHAGASVNDVTDDTNFDALTATASFRVDVTVC